MRPSLITVFLLCCFFSPVAAPVVFADEEDEKPVHPIEVGAADWPWWRGPQHNGIAAADQQPPLTWSDSENVLWKVPVPGRGHGSATVVGDQVFLATADVETQLQSVLCFDRQTGEQKWSTIVHEGGIPDAKNKRAAGNEKASFASSTIACDGTYLFINFLSAGAVYTSALNRDGRLLWQTKISDYVVHQGYGSSPMLYKDLAIVSADNKGGGAIAALKRKTGQIAWKLDRPKKPNYASPIVLRVAGKDQLLFTGCDFVTSLNPLTGGEYWQIEGATTECVTTTVTDGKHIFTSGGYPKNHIAAVAADGAGKVVWENTTRAYVPSMLQQNGYLYAVLDAGIAICLSSSTGEETWKSRLAGTFSGSPVLVGDRLYATNEEGTTFVLKVSPQGSERLATNRLGEGVFATPTICGGRIYQRVSHKEDGKRQEYLYCLGQK
jgi:outer membrane protein assembly factor BamB